MDDGFGDNACAELAASAGCGDCGRRGCVSWDVRFGRDGDFGVGRGLELGERSEIAVLRFSNGFPARAIVGSRDWRRHGERWRWRGAGAHIHVGWT